MERLTRRSANGTGVYATPSGEPIEWENNRHNVLQKLADYEDLEEQGRLIKLPCKVGDTVWDKEHYIKSLVYAKKSKEARIKNEQARTTKISAANDESSRK